MGFTNPRDSRVGFTVSDLHACVRTFGEQKFKITGTCPEKIKNFSRATYLFSGAIQVNASKRSRVKPSAILAGNSPRTRDAQAKLTLTEST
jgi:hypothetical protein